MTQMKPPRAMSLFDLIARTWVVEDEIRQVLFNAAGSSVMVMLANGRLTFVSVKDAEHPDTRLRVEADTGRTSIRPRRQPLPAPVVSETPVAQTEVAACRLGAQGFVFAHRETGLPWRATARGQTLAFRGGGALTAVAALPGAERIVRAGGNRVSLVPEVGGDALVSAELPHEVSRIAVSADGAALACAGAGRISLLSARTLERRGPVQEAGAVLDMAFSPCGRWLVAGCWDKSVLLIDAENGTADRIVDFPQPVGSVAFSAVSGALLAAGAFRATGWRLPDLPFGDHAGEPIATGKPGLTIVDRIAAHPARDLCAVAYANGLVVICRIGHPDEMMLREGTGVPVRALSWSDDGAHLAIGDADGTLSIATFPKNMFK